MTVTVDQLHDITITAALDDASPGLTGVLGIPTTPGPWPAVVVVHEIFGIDEEMRKQVAHLASLGYLALMPDLFTSGGMLRCIGATMKSLGSGKGRAYADIESARQYLLALDDSNGAVGVIGFCMGGGFAIMAAANGYHGGESGFDAASVSYGIMPKDLDAIEHSCPVVASYGGLDGTLKGAAAKLEKKYTELGVPHDVKEYPHAGHVFMNDKLNGPALIRPLVRVMNFGPNPEAAADAWKRIDAFFGEHLRR
ncbi:dienelactone hydrolase family protein [soil metagenome]